MTTRRLLATAALAVVLGILGMHALSLSDGFDGGHGPDAAAATMDAMHHDGAPAPAPGDGQHQDHSVAMLCLAMLGGAAVTVVLLLLLVGRLPRLATAVARAPRSIRSVLVDRPARAGPPVVWEFSVIRC